MPVMRAVGIPSIEQDRSVLQQRHRNFVSGPDTSAGDGARSLPSVTAVVRRDALHPAKPEVRGMFLEFGFAVPAQAVEAWFPQSSSDKQTAKAINMALDWSAARCTNLGRPARKLKN
jgi:hypothetical protein